MVTEQGSTVTAFGVRSRRFAIEPRREHNAVRAALRDSERPLSGKSRSVVGRLKRPAKIAKGAKIAENTALL